MLAVITTQTYRRPVLSQLVLMPSWKPAIRCHWVDWPWCLGPLVRHARPWRPRAMTASPYTYTSVWFTGLAHHCDTSVWTTATRTASSDNRRPTDAISGAWSQPPMWGDDEAKSLALYFSAVYTLCSEKKHPLTFSFISPWIIYGFKQKLQWIYPRIDRFW